MRTPEYEEVAEAGKAVEYGLSDVAEKIGTVAKSGAWRRYVTPTRRVVEFASFRAFVEGDRPDGLGTDVDTIRKVCADDSKALGRVEQALKQPHGGDRRSPEARTKTSIVSLDPGTVGNTKAQAIRRLRKDRPDLLARVIAGEMSPHAAAVEAGHRKRTITVPVAEPERIAATLRRQLPPDVVTEVGHLLIEAP